MRWITQNWCILTIVMVILMLGLYQNSLQMVNNGKGVSINETLYLLGCVYIGYHASRSHHVYADEQRFHGHGLVVSPSLPTVKLLFCSLSVYRIQVGPEKTERRISDTRPITHSI